MEKPTLLQEQDHPNEVYKLENKLRIMCGNINICAFFSTYNCMLQYNLFSQKGAKIRFPVLISVRVANALGTKVGVIAERSGKNRSRSAHLVLTGQPMSGIHVDSPAGCVVSGLSIHNYFDKLYGYIL